MARAASTVTSLQTSRKPQDHSASPTSSKVLVEANAKDIDEALDSADLCLTTAKLITELLLMLFAATLLLIVVIVLLSRNIPAFMESYDIVPKILFFLCVFVASYSFLRWLIEKVYRKCDRNKSRLATEQLGQSLLVVSTLGGTTACSTNDNKSANIDRKPDWRGANLSKVRFSLSEPHLGQLDNKSQMDPLLGSIEGDKDDRTMVQNENHQLYNPMSATVRTANGHNCSYNSSVDWDTDSDTGRRRTIRLSRQVPPSRQVSVDSPTYEPLEYASRHPRGEIIDEEFVSRVN